MLTSKIYQPSASRYDNSGTMYARCGQSGVMLPRLSLGLWHNFGGNDPYERCREIARYAFDHGVTHFDLANNYGPPYGSAEETMEEGILDYCADNGIGFISFSPLAQGLLTDRYLDGIPEDSRIARGGHLKKDALTPEMLDRLRELNNEAKGRGETLAGEALRWILRQRGVTSVLTGASSKEQLAENLKSVEEVNVSDRFYSSI